MEYFDRLRDLLPKIVNWIKSEQLGWHEMVVVVQTRFMRCLKSGDFDLNCPSSSIGCDDLVIKWDQGWGHVNYNLNTTFVTFSIYSNLHLSNETESDQQPGSSGQFL